MTINGLIGLLNIVIACGLVSLAGGLFWRSRHRWVQWPVSAPVALGGVFLATGLGWGQLSLFRHTDLPSPAMPNGWATLGLRVVCAVVVVALAWRVYAGTLLTDADRREGGAQ